ncbi:hypothetical protein MTR67_029167 [Solanum verrucosum]|uniref:Uncharacterized protein n=1 Tax=Solanum verrucosum TaxID=315347 RepID=A0AAF0TWH0_SOLVR|nr:hypothetical protein MTR67_029167 [Solanum verrucosum]
MVKVAELEAAEKDKMREKVQNIISHVINCFGNRQLTYNISEEQFAEAGILVIERLALLVAQLRAEHHKEENNAGIDVITGQVGDMAELGISEAFKVKQAVLLSATEAAEMILRLMKSSHMPPWWREDRM